MATAQDFYVASPVAQLQEQCRESLCKKHVYNLNAFGYPSIDNAKEWEAARLPELKAAYIAAYTLLSRSHSADVRLYFDTPYREYCRLPLHLEISQLRRQALVLTFQISGLSQNAFSRLWGINEKGLREKIDKVYDEREAHPVLCAFMDTIEQALVTGDYASAIAF